MSLTQPLDGFLRQQTQIILIVDEYGGMEGIQKLARRLWKQRAKKMKLNLDDFGKIRGRVLAINNSFHLMLGNSFFKLIHLWACLNIKLD